MYTQPFTHDVARDLEYLSEDYSATTAYARTKRMQVIVSEQLATRFDVDGITVHCMHPGWAATPGVTDSLPRFSAVMKPLLRSPAEGADTVVWLAASPEAVESTGEFWCDRRPRPTAYLPWQRETPSDRALLWDSCVDAIGIDA
jgi:NAD(P)-dependent dehydrogenase (short-subunit alcohol dehydrogenase family)